MFLVYVFRGVYFKLPLDHEIHEAIYKHTLNMANTKGQVKENGHSL